MFNFCKLVVLTILMQVTDPITYERFIFHEKLGYNFSVSSSDFFIKKEGEVTEQSMQTRGG